VLHKITLVLEKHEIEKLRNGEVFPFKVGTQDVELFFETGRRPTPIALSEANGNGHNGPGVIGKNQTAVFEQLKKRPMRRREIAALAKTGLKQISYGLLNLKKKGLIKKGAFGWEIANGK